MSKALDLTGHRFGRLTAIRREGSYEYGGGRKIAMWLCKCECGNTKVIRCDSLRNGKTSSCGCYHDEVTNKVKVTHNMSKTRLYTIWGGMKQRCLNANTPNFHNYGGRGITVCDDWVNSFEAFKEWALSNNYSEELSLDRIDNSGNYEPNNCRWTDKKTQSNNTRQNHLITYNDKTQTIAQWAEEIGLEYDTLFNRLVYLGWSVEKALSTPLMSNQYSLKKIKGN